MNDLAWLNSLEIGQPIAIDNGKMGIQKAKVYKLTPQQVQVKFGREVRKFSRHDGGTFQAPTASKSWLVQVRND